MNIKDSQCDQVNSWIFNPIDFFANLSMYYWCSSSRVLNTYLFVTANDKNLDQYNSVNRFNNRVSYYSKYRPDYPESLFNFLEVELKLNKEMTIVEVGSGTGLFSGHLLRRGYNLICIEPNKEMRDYSAKLFSTFPSFTLRDTTAEDTMLNSKSIDCIFVAQAFHWFDSQKVKNEFQRIIKPNGVIAICWILSDLRADFQREFEMLRQRFAVRNYPHIRNDEEVLTNFYLPGKMNKKVLYFKTRLNFDTLKGLLLSVSFIPQENHPDFLTMIDDLKQLFNKYSINGFVELDYQLPIYWNVN